MESNHTKISWKILLRLGAFLKPYRFWVFVTTLCSLANVILYLAFAYLIQNLIDTSITTHHQQFREFLFLALGLIVAGSIVAYLNRYASAYYGAYAIRDLRNLATIHLQWLPVSYIESHHTGDIISRLNNDVTKISDFLQTLPGRIYEPFMFMGAFIYMVLISWKLLIAACILIPISGLLFNKISKPIQQYSGQQMSDLARASEAIQDTIAGTAILKAFNLQAVMSEKYREIAQSIEQKGSFIDKRVSYLFSIYIALRIIPQLIVPLYGGYLALQGEMTIGRLLAANLLVWYIFWPVESFLDWLKKVRETLPATKRVFQLLDQPTEHTGEQTFEIDPKAIPLEFVAVSFNYDGGKTVLNNLSFQVPEGKTVVLVGASGSGKSTVFKLLCGFYKPQTSRINLYNQDIFQSDLAMARTQMAFVSQDTYLFPTTIAENIAYGRPGAGQDEIVAAAKAANAHEFIMNQPKTYGTPVGERGIKLSGGERQRIALARAILKDAPILLLDEPTSALDAQSERRMQEALERLMKGRTTLVVAHRLSTIKNADQILVLDQGFVRGCGTHESLMKTNLYKKLYLNQLQSPEHVPEQPGGEVM